MASTNAVTKRPNTDESGSSNSKKPKLYCSYGEKCYRRNPVHFAEYSHPHLEKLYARQKSGEDLKLPLGYKAQIDADVILAQLQFYRDQQVDVKQDIAANETSQNQEARHSAPAPPTTTTTTQSGVKRGFANRLSEAGPYNFFLTAVRDSPQTHRERLSIRFHELLDPSLGDLDSSLQINFMVELDWLLEMYKVYEHEKKPIFILHGEDDETLRNPKSLFPNITLKKIKPSAFGHHHTKMSLLYYKDGSMRVVVSTANLISSDWYNRTQGVWVSPSCPQLPADADTRAGDSETEFKTDLLRYMASYQLPTLQEWMSRLRKTDFSAIKVFLVASVPGSHRGPDSDKWGHKRLGSILKKYAKIPSLLSPSGGSWPVIAQCSSIGTLGSDPDSWMCGELRTSMSQKMMQPGDLPQPPPPFRVVYPTLQNVKNSHDDLLGGGCLPYSRRTHEKTIVVQKVSLVMNGRAMEDIVHKAMPHIKTYTRVSPCAQYLAWFHLTSANLSKAAWGKVQDSKGKTAGPGLYIMSYEAGVLFLPKLLINEPVFNIRRDDDTKTYKNSPFPLPWDLPLTAYGADDMPWVQEYML